MPHLLLFEIWEDSEAHSFELSRVTERGDELRRKTAPGSVLRHRFHAASDWEAYQMNNDWHGWGRWIPEPEWTQQHFTAEDVAVQERYLAVRNSG
jgi:hypothetical protein